MSDEVFDYELANIKLSLIHLSKEEKDFCDQLFVRANVQTNFSEQYQYVFHDVLREQTIVGEPIELFNAKYYINGNMCNVDFKNGGKASWDLLSKTFRFQEGTKQTNLRNWFFLNIIDPFSLVCTNQNKLVVHGSLWEYNGLGSIICGVSGSGKSTLSFLARHTVAVHCDDCVVLSQEKQKVFAYPIHAGFGIRNNVLSEYKIDLDKNNILVKNKEKVYFKRLNGLPAIAARVPIKNIFILQKNSCENTRIQEIPATIALKVFLNLQTNLPTTYFIEKYRLIKLFLQRCKLYVVEYNEICDVNILLEQLMEG